MDKSFAPRSSAPRGLESPKRVQLLLSGSELAEVQHFADAEHRTTGAMGRVLLLEGLALRRQRDGAGNQPHADGVEHQ